MRRSTLKTALAKVADLSTEPAVYVGRAALPSRHGCGGIGRSPRSVILPIRHAMSMWNLVGEAIRNAERVLGAPPDGTEHWLPSFHAGSYDPLTQSMWAEIHWEKR